MYPGDSQSDFRISSPLKPTDGFDTEGAQIQLPLVKRSSDQNSAQGMILLVDDEEVTRRLLAHQLEAAGYEIITASNGYEALMLVRASKPDLVLMDISMPVMDGLTSLRMMRQLYNNADLPIVMMTSDAEEAQVGGCFDAGASDYLAKPVQHESMLARIEAQLKLMRVLSRHCAKASNAILWLLRVRGMEFGIGISKLAKSTSRPVGERWLGFRIQTGLHMVLPGWNWCSKKIVKEFARISKRT